MSPFIIKKLDIVKPNVSQINLYDQILVQMDAFVTDKIENQLKKSKFLNNVHWDGVKQNVFNQDYSQVKTNYAKERNLLEPKTLNSMKDSTQEELLEARFRFLKISKSLYWKYFLRGLCNGYVTIQLMEAADQSIDNVNKPINDWDYVQKEIVSGFADKIISKATFFTFY